MRRTTISKSGRAQAVRRTGEAAFPKDVRDVLILRGGMRRVIVPADQSWDDFFAAPGIDLGDRAQPATQEPLAHPG